MKIMKNKEVREVKGLPEKNPLKQYFPTKQPIAPGVDTKGKK